MPVVSDTSPLLNLAVIGQLDLLRRQFGPVRIPPAVRDELRLDADLPGTEAIREAIADGWIAVISLENTKLAQALRRSLDRGEAEAIALAIESCSRQVLLDEHDGRAVAEDLGLQPVGVVGVLLRAKRDGDLRSVGTALEQLRAQAGFYLSDRLVERVLVEAGESTRAPST